MADLAWSGTTPHGHRKDIRARTRAPAEEVVAEEPQPVATVEAIDPQVTQRADTGAKGKTTLPRIAGGFKLPPSSLLRRADEQQTVDPDELKQVCTNSS